MKRASLFLPVILLWSLVCIAESPAVIETDETWTAEGSPYLIDRDLTIAQGATLTIEPGVTVNFYEGCSLFIKGQLVAIGTTEKQILFTGVETEGEHQRWGSIVFEDSSLDAEYTNLDEYSKGSIVSQCVIEYASRALQVHSSSPFIQDSVFRYNYFSYTDDTAGGAAILITQKSSPRVTGCQFIENIASGLAQGGAIYIESSDPIIHDNIFKSNTSFYGGAISANSMSSPLVGNFFEENFAYLEGGAISLVSTISAILNNRIKKNSSYFDGGGVHVCVDCFPHANPFFWDNTIVNNTNLFSGAAGIGAAFIRYFSYNNIHGNLRSDEPADFGWFNESSETYPSWVVNPTIPHNWWGTTDATLIDETIFDGHDEPGYGLVTYQPVLSAQHPDCKPRITITTQKIRFTSEYDTMPVFVTIYNPGPGQEIELAIILQYGENQRIFYDQELDFPGAERKNDLYHLALPENSVWFSTLLTSLYEPMTGVDHGYWHAALFEVNTGTRIGDVCSIRFEFGSGGTP
ncbi:right-handed parallel beta-helix repeat-containing protein [candidate division CSSED10-310 bacterium]|uniref:Right-handed parallel beta-helix repeat-containing protein n=1 Tax=candidate division CSSED10-310 bacterium TaxID=2855610 RepID=A0ABV6Z518_UNCC1